MTPNVSQPPARSLNAHEPAPKRKGNGTDCWPLVISEVDSVLGGIADHRILELLRTDMRERDGFGRAKYGGPLEADDGRDSAVDVYQEVLDQIVYARKGAYEAAMAQRWDRWTVLFDTYREALTRAAVLRALLASEGK